MTTTAASTFTVNGISLSPGSSPTPARAPNALIATRAVELKDGWAGQVIVGGTVVLEDPGWEDACNAEEWATNKVLEVIKGLFTTSKGDN